MAENEILAPMGRFFRKQLTYFLIGFVVAFVLYLFIRFDSDKVILGVVISASAGVVLCLAIAILDRRFPEEPPSVGAKK